MSSSHFSTGGAAARAKAGGPPMLFCAFPMRLAKPLVSVRSAEAEDFPCSECMSMRSRLTK